MAKADMEQFIKSQLLKADLIEIDRQLSATGINDMTSMLLLKQAFITVSNLVDFEITIRSIYREHKNLSSEYKSSSKNYEFAKYLRNKYIGHIKQELIQKSIEWKPELRYSLKRINEPGMMFIFNLFILETAINTYVNDDGSHKIFESETDLKYPPDLKRFLIYLSSTVSSAISYLSNLASALGERVEMLDASQQKIEHWIAAGETKFEFIKK
jgi:hypothetical protein